GSDINTGTEDAKIVTPKAIADSNVIFKPGMIIPYAGSSAPSGWLICDGSAVSRTTYSALFAVIGTTYGVGDGSTTFNLPNLKGRVPVGLDTSQTEFNTLGKIGGEKTHTLTISEMPSHDHNSNYYIWNSHSGSLSTFFSPGAAYGINTFNNNLPTSSTGDNQPHNNLQPYITLNYIIKY
ncbi:MAG: tail fiber protein, partial [Candidatus Woesearchaeota archaeon]